MSTAVDSRGQNEPILLLGGNGQVGTEVRSAFEGHAALVAPQRSELNLADPAAIRRIIREVGPRWIINAAAYTAVDKAEAEPQAAYAINAEAVGIIGQEAAVLGSPVVHFSTDYVFDGTGSEPRREDDPKHPLGVYGASKLAGEAALLASGAPCFIFRTSWVYSAHGKNFLLTMLKLAEEREELRVVRDQVGAPTFARDLAHLVQHAITVAEHAAAQEQVPLGVAMGRMGGLFHACNQGETSWFGFAEELLRQAYSRQLVGRLPRVTPIAAAEYPTPARRPANSRLDCSRLKQRLGFVMPAWQHSLEAAMEELLQSRPPVATAQQRR